MPTKKFSIHPGEILLTEFMQPHKLTAYRLAKEINVPLPRVNDVVLGKRSISADTALRLGKYFGLPAQFWLNLQNDYDIRNANTADLAKIKPLKAA
jgi:addiction module HigA family antidote